MNSQSQHPRKAMYISLTATTGEHMQAMAEESDLVVIEISHSEILSGITGDTVDRLMQLSDSKSFTEKFANSTILVVDGYGDDPRELHQIPEVTKFVRAVTGQWPYWFHFLEKAGPSIGLILQLMCDQEAVHEGGKLRGFRFKEKEQLRVQMMTMFNAMNRLYEHHAFESIKATEMTGEVMAALDRVMRAS